MRSAKGRDTERERARNEFMIMTFSMSINVIIFYDSFNFLSYKIFHLSENKCERYTSTKKVDCHFDFIERKKTKS